MDILFGILVQYVQILFECFKYDVWFYSQWWTWAFIGIPAVVYFPIVLFKWVVLTLPISVTIGAIARGPFTLFGSFGGQAVESFKERLNKKKKS